MGGFYNLGGLGGTLKAAYTSFIVFSHLASLAFAVYSTQTSGVRTTVLLYAFIIDYVFRLITIHTFHLWLQRPAGGALGSAAAFLSRRPAKGQKSERMVNSKTGRAAGLPTYLALMALLAYFAFALANANDDGQSRIDVATVVDDLNWAIAIGAVYWINGLLTQTIVIHPNQPLIANLGYNTKEITLLSAAVLLGAAVFMVRKTMDYPASAWTVMAPLMILRTVTDLSARLSRKARVSAA